MRIPPYWSVTFTCSHFCMLLSPWSHYLTIDTLHFLSFSMSGDMNRSRDKCVIFVFSECAAKSWEQGTNWDPITLASILLFFILHRNKSHEIVVKLPICMSWTHAICGSAFMPIYVTACVMKHEPFSYAQIQCASVDHIKKTKKKNPTPPTNE